MKDGLHVLTQRRVEIVSDRLRESVIERLSLYSYLCAPTRPRPQLPRYHTSKAFLFQKHILDTIFTMDSPRPTKRQRTLPSPPTTIHDPEASSILDRAIRVLSIEATALSHVTRLYQTDPAAREGLLNAVETIAKSQEAGGKVIICGVGKSGLVGRKTTATMKSLGIGVSFLHAAEAAHGDLGDIKKVRAD